MKSPITYENDKDLSELIYTQVTDEKLLSLFFKKGGKVNVNNLQYCMIEYGKKQIAQNIVNLETAGLIKPINSFEYSVTRKARWARIRDNKTISWIGIIAGVIAVLITLLQALKIL